MFVKVFRPFMIAFFAYLLATKLMIQHETKRRCVTYPLRWDGVVTYYIQPTNMAPLEYDRFSGYVSSAYTQWQSVSSLRVMEVTNPENAHITISFSPIKRKGSLGMVSLPRRTKPFLTLNDYKELSENTGNMIINSNFKWTPHLLEHVILHEAGHSLGVCHSKKKDSVMYLSVSPKTVTSTPKLSDEDIVEITQRYGE